jgi:two-component system, NarL family, sensor histidine kinase DesK
MTRPSAVPASPPLAGPGVPPRDLPGAEPPSSEPLSPVLLSPEPPGPEPPDPDLGSQELGSQELLSPEPPGPEGPQRERPGAAIFRRVLGWPRKSGALGGGLDPAEPGRPLRRLIVSVAIILFLIGPDVAAVIRQSTPRTLAALACVAVFTVLVIRVIDGPTVLTPWSRVLLVLIVGLAIALFALTGEQNSGGFTALAIAAAACGRFIASIRPAIFGAVTCSAAGLITAAADHYNQGSMAAVLIVPPLGAFFAYTAGKRNESVAILRRTRAELARVAVSEERLRIARDLHDLLGHSLSLITLKAELSQRVLDSDPARAGREMAELEAVARQSLSDVREAVAGYRQPDLAAELGAARQLLTLSGVECRISAPDHFDLPGEVDAVAAWTIREGVTNVVRHARAASATITVIAGHDIVTAEIVDDGPSEPGSPSAESTPAGLAGSGPAASGSAASGSAGSGSVGSGSAGSGSVGSGSAGSGSVGSGLDGSARSGVAGLRPAGSGLAGLSERVRALGGDLVAEHIRPRGFRLRVTIPVGAGPGPR